MIKNEAEPKRRLEVFSWIFYDFANTVYSMNVVSMYFPLWMRLDNGMEDLSVGVAHAISMILVAFSMPVLGAISDRMQRRMPFLIGFTFTCALFTALIGLIGQSGFSLQLRVFLALCFFVLANYSYQGGQVFYNALLTQVSTSTTIGKISGYGVAFGYLGAIVGLILVMPFNEGGVFGIAVPFLRGAGRVATFVPTAVLLLMFSLPTFVFVKDRRRMGEPAVRRSWREGLERVREVFVHRNAYPGVFRFLAAKFIYENAIYTVIIFMAVYAEMVMGFSDAVVMPFFIVSTISAIIGSAICGRIVDRLGAKRTLQGALLGWIGALCLVLTTDQHWVFWIAGSLIGIFLGSTWTAARPLLVNLVPQEMLGEFFGLYALSGKLAAVFGPLVWGLVVRIFRPYPVLKYKLAVGTLLILIGVGLAIFWRIPEKRLRASMI
jgi:UMF1 family MFS transporter